MNIQRQTQRTGGDYRPRGVVVTSVLEPTTFTNGTSSGQSQTFFVRKEQSYTNGDGLVEKQPLDLQCTTFNPAVIQMLATLQPDATVDLVGWLEPSWRGYVADNTPDGDRFPIPDGDRVDPVMSPKGRAIQPDAHPYRMSQGKPNVITYDVKQIQVTEMTLANAVETETVDTNQDAWASATAEQQQNLNQATQPQQGQQQPQQQPQQGQPQAGQVPYGG